MTAYTITVDWVCYSAYPGERVEILLTEAGQHPRCIATAASPGQALDEALKWIRDRGGRTTRRIEVTAM